MRVKCLNAVNGAVRQVPMPQLVQSVGFDQARKRGRRKYHGARASELVHASMITQDEWMLKKWQSYLDFTEMLRCMLRDASHVFHRDASHVSHRDASRAMTCAENLTRMVVRGSPAVPV
jgi:hypothetical protein